MMQFDRQNENLSLLYTIYGTLPHACGTWQRDLE